MDQPVPQSDSKISIDQAFVFKVGNVLGGRSEVLKAPFSDLLKYMNMQMTKEEMEAEKEQAKMWINYLTAVFTQPSFGGEEDPSFTQAKKEFANFLMPKQKQLPNEPPNPEAEKAEWNFNQIEQLKAQQEAFAARKGVTNGDD